MTTKACLTALLLIAPAAVAQDLPGDPVAGRTFAEGLCADCHGIEPDSYGSPNPLAPPFADVAADPKMTELAIRVFLQSPHPTMPNFILAPEDTDNIVAYILSLEAAREDQ